MRLEWLEDVLAVAETGSFQEAADRRRIDPIGLLATNSAYRGTDSASNCSTGRASRCNCFPPRRTSATRLRELANDLRQLVSDLRRGERIASNRIAIASQHALTTSFTPRVVRAIHARHEAAHVRLRSANLDECFSLLLSRQVDIAIVYRLPGEDHPISQSFVETIVIGTDRLVPVVATTAADELARQIAAGELPYISFPPDVFLGGVLDRVVLNRLHHLARPIPKAETALTLAALELAMVGVGVAWVPLSLARNRIDDGSLVDLSADLPWCQLEVTSVRLFGNPWPVAELGLVRDPRYRVVIAR